MRVLADRKRHDELFQRSVARPLADAVDGALDLAGAGPHRRQGICHGQAQVVVAVDGNDHVIDTRHVLHQVVHNMRVFVGNRVAHRIRDVDGGRPRVDGGPNNPG